MKKIGIGVTTFNRPQCLEKWLFMVNTCTPDKSNVKIHVAQDSVQDRKGVAGRKNECLRSLIECDYVFLFDDDCYPVQAGWIDYFVNSGCEHLLYSTERHHGKMKKSGNLMIFENTSGVFMFLTKSAIDRVGGFDEKFFPYGFEHIDYSIRVLGKKEYPVLEYTESFIYAEDFYNPQNKSSMSELERVQSANKNFSYFNTINQTQPRHIPL